MASIVVGGHYGDEGKGKVVSYLALNDNPAVIARGGVGPNAGHTVYKDGVKYGLRMLTCGFVNENARLAIGAGVLVDVDCFLAEVEKTKTEGRIFVDKRCAIIEKKHKELDAGANSKKIGTTGSGCGPANAARVNRTAKLAAEIPELKGYLADVPQMINDAARNGEEVLVEASQGFGLSLYYGNYPYVTSKDTSAASACADVGLGPTNVDNVYVIFKAYMSRVGEDPHIHYLDDAEIEKDPLWKKILERAGLAGSPGDTDNQRIAFYFGEKGTVTGRPRKIGAFDFELARYSCMVNGATQIAVTCVDRMFPDCAGAKKYDELSNDAKKYLDKIEEEVGVPITLISTGPDVYDVVDLRK
ncbi:MAG: adenylosuccinate synthetase [Candidatus Altiarchaeota archaeon]